jgi:hypothetical protein
MEGGQHFNNSQKLNVDNTLIIKSFVMFGPTRQHKSVYSILTVVMHITLLKPILTTRGASSSRRSMPQEVTSTRRRLTTMRIWMSLLIKKLEAVYNFDSLKLMSANVNLESCTHFEKVYCATDGAGNQIFCQFFNYTS